MGVARFDVFVVDLDPTVGSEIRKSRPCVVVSPDEMNGCVRTVDKVRLVKRLGALEPDEAAAILEVLRELFAP